MAKHRCQGSRTSFRSRKSRRWPSTSRRCRRASRQSDATQKKAAAAAFFPCRRSVGSLQFQSGAESGVLAVATQLLAAFRQLKVHDQRSAVSANGAETKPLAIERLLGQRNGLCTELVQIRERDGSRAIRRKVHDRDAAAHA